MGGFRKGMRSAGLKEMERGKWEVQTNFANQVKYFENISCFPHQHGELKLKWLNEYQRGSNPSLIYPAFKC